jgi:hypothetical protein
MKAFLTAYDPSDLPGGSIDPLGFERGYLFLADKILPGMTNVASCPRYFGVLCAGSLLAVVSTESSPRAQRAARQECILRFEKLWALANVLSARKNGKTEPSGLRGVTYATRQRNILEEQKQTKTDCKFRLLIRQVPYGVLGIYGSVAENARLIYKTSYELSPGLGEPLGEAFLEETYTPQQVKKAVREDGEVSLAVLTEWGERAYLWAKAGKRESYCISEALHSDCIRSRFTRILAEHPFKENEPELERLKRITASFAKDPSNRDLWESAECILRYETCYQLSMLLFERILYLCRNRCDASGRISIEDLDHDEVARYVRENLPPAVSDFIHHIGSAETQHFGKGLDRLWDVERFLQQAANSCESGSLLADTILARHRDVQHGKFDRGMRKMPWVQNTEGKLALTMTRVGGLTKEATEPSDIAPHPYRIYAADNWLQAAGGS